MLKPRGHSTVTETLGYHLMDPRHQNQNSLPDDHPLRVPFGFNSAQHDPFNPIFNHESDSTFNPAWDTEAFRTPVEPTSGFDQSGHAWHPNSLQTSNLFSGPNYTVQPGAYDQTYSPNPTSFNYSSFNSTPSHALAPQSYDSSLSYNQLPLTEDGQFDFSRSQGFQRGPTQSQTISPQALQNYPNAFQQQAAQPIRQVSFAIILPNLFIKTKSPPAHRLLVANPNDRSCINITKAVLCISSPAANNSARMEITGFSHASEQVGGDFQPERQGIVSLKHKFKAFDRLYICRT